MARKKTTKHKGGAPKWLAPVGIGVGLLGVGLMSRRASAKSSSSSSTDSTDPAPIHIAKTDPVPTPSNPSSFEIEFPTFEGQDGAFMLQELMKAAGPDAQWRRFFLATGRGESGFTSNVVLGNRSQYPKGSKPSPLTDTLGPSEANGARLAYERAASQNRLEGCPWPSTAYTWGSGGWWGMLPANAWYAYLGTSLKCRHPWYMLHPVDQTVTAIDFARRLTGWSAFKAEPTWLTLRVGWGNPSAMDDPQARERVASKLGKQLEALGLSKAWMYEQVTALPDTDIEVTWEQLMREFDFEPGRKGA